MHPPAEVPPFVAPPFGLHPFRAWRLSGSRLGDPSALRVFGRPHAEVRSRLETWARRGATHHDRTPAFYLHEYTVDGLTVRGLVGALDLAARSEARDPRVVHPHEGVHADQVVDLARRMEVMELNPAPILLVHRGGSRITELLRVGDTPPTHAFTDRAQQRHRIWTVTDPELLERTTEELASTEALIADGHHRFAAYLRLQEQHPGTGWDRGLVMLVDQDDTPLHLGAIHRQLHGTTIDDLCAAALDVGGAWAETGDRAGAMAGLGSSTAVLHDGTRWATLTLPGDDEVPAVCRLHDRVIPALESAPRMTVHHSVAAGLAALEQQRGVLVILPAPEYDAVAALSAVGRLLPEKATSFQPKPTIGALMRSPADEE